ncbi:hypothetical protein TPAR_01890 [Tolypocladium paradoxum]|uniref:Uncharacterized protein n=1 Tax=Tolypocladium paradoxum TaxID=94208 RepID=A0A2S4L681_9HYPO|nr:hypothetical protein TPAR_01890 [Tolypocladium paradoxum]
MTSGRAVEWRRQGPGAANARSSRGYLGTYRSLCCSYLYSPPADRACCGARQNSQALAASSESLHVASTDRISHALTAHTIASPIPCVAATRNSRAN